MPKKEQLFFLIKSLTKPEKRHFKLFVSADKGASNYLRLFDFLDKMAHYDEDKIRKKFRNEAFIRQLHVTKNYLNKLILRSLRNYHSKISKDAELHDLLKNIEILHSKELFEQCGEQIEKAQKLAMAYEKYPLLLDILEWKRRLLMAQIGPGGSKDALNEIITEKQKAAEIISTENEYWRLAVNVFQFMNFPAEFNAEKMPEHSLLKNIDAAKTQQAKILYYYLWQTWHYVNGDLEKSMDIAAASVKLIEADAKRIKDNPGSYITALNNLVSMHLQMGNHQAVPAFLEKIRAIPETYGLDRNSKIAVKMMLQTYNVELEMYRDNADYENGIALTAVAEAFMAKHNHAVPDVYRVLLNYQFSYLHFMTGDYDNALARLNEILSRNYENAREDIQSYAQLLRLMIHFELGNITVLKYSVESCRRFLKKYQNLQDYESTLLRFFAKLSLAYPEEYLPLFKQTFAALFGKPMDAKMRSRQDYLDVKGWMERKIAGNI